MSKHTKKQALAYLRVSGKGQVNKDGFPRQREAVRKYAKANGLDIIGEYRDEGVSGTKELEHRQGLAALLDYIESNGVRIVLVERADRLARDLMVGEVILGQFRDLGVSVISADSGVDLTTGDDDPTRTLIRQVLGAVSQFEKSIIVLKLRAARQRTKQKTGRCEGRKPYGYYPGEDKVIERIKQLYRKPHKEKRLGFGTIARKLNEEKIPTRTGVLWSDTQIKAILSRKNRLLKPTG
jgi:DNA invertase Pin-like site-specific DNA recombinase